MLNSTALLSMSLVRSSSWGSHTRRFTSAIALRRLCTESIDLNVWIASRRSVSSSSSISSASSKRSSSLKRGGFWNAGSAIPDTPCPSFQCENDIAYHRSPERQTEGFRRGSPPSMGATRPLRDDPAGKVTHRVISTPRLNAALRAMIVDDYHPFTRSPRQWSVVSGRWSVVGGRFAGRREHPPQRAALAPHKRREGQHIAAEADPERGRDA